MPRIRTILLGMLLLSLVASTATAADGSSSRTGFAQAGLMSVGVLYDEHGNDNAVIMLAATAGPRVEDVGAKVDPSAFLLVCRDQCIGYRPAVFTLATDTQGGRLTGMDSYLGMIDLEWVDSGELLMSDSPGIGIAQCSGDGSRSYSMEMRWSALGGLNDAVNGARRTEVSGHVGPFTIGPVFAEGTGSLSVRNMVSKADITWTNGNCDGS